MVPRGYFLSVARLCAALGLAALLTACAPLPQTPAAPTVAPAASTGVPDVEVSPLEGLPKNQDGYTDISVLQLAGSMVTKNYKLVNVHIPYEGELPGTDLFIPYNEIEQQTAKLPDKNAPVVLYCRSGSMSTTAAHALVRLGYTNVYEVDGGMVAWESAGWDLLFRE